MSLVRGESQASVSLFFVLFLIKLFILRYSLPCSGKREYREILEALYPVSPNDNVLQNDTQKSQPGHWYRHSEARLSSHTKTPPIALLQPQPVPTHPTLT